MSKSRKKYSKKCPECEITLKNIKQCEEVIIDGEKFIENKNIFICPECGYKLNKKKKHREIKREKENKKFNNKW